MGKDSVNIITGGLHMKMLSNHDFNNAAQYIMNNGRYLEKLLYEHHFIAPCDAKIIKALEMYQNKDGGYGNALEPDFRLPHSSPMATSIALRCLKELDRTENSLEQIGKAIKYLESTFQEPIMGWESVSKMVNLFPHAPWWYRMDEIDFISGNPSAELAAYLNLFRDHTSDIDPDKLAEFYVSQLENMMQYDEHEIYCYTILYDVLPQKFKKRMKHKLVEAYEELVSTDSNEWGNYVPYPLKFIDLTKENLFPVRDSDLNTNLDYVIELIESKGHIAPTWKWTEFESEWEVAKREWTGKLTLDHLLLLKRFNRIEDFPLQK